MTLIKFSNCFINIDKVCVIKSINNDRTGTYTIEFWVSGCEDAIEEKYKSRSERDTRLNCLIGAGDLPHPLEKLFN